MDPDTIAKMTDMIRALNDMRTAVILFVIGFAVLTFCGFMYYLRWKAKKETAERKEEDKRQREKMERANKYSSALQGVAQALAVVNNRMDASLASVQTTLQSHQQTLQSVNQMTISTLVRLDGAINNMIGANKELTERLTAKMTPKDSVAYIQRVFLSEIYHAVLELTRTAIVDNGYEDNKEFISNRVRTEIGGVLRVFRSELASFNALTVRVPDFFEMESADPLVERFVLCNQLWSVAENYLKEGTKDGADEHQEMISRRLADAGVVVQNTIRDYFIAIARSKYPDVYETQEIPVAPPRRR